ncbi:MAG: response regulator [Gemmatimonadota bacterium]
MADEYRITLLGLTDLLRSRRELRVCGEATTVREALALVNEMKPGLVVTGLNLQAADAFDFIEEMARRHPEARILVLSAHDENLYAERVIRAGAHGYVPKTASLDQFLTAIDTVLGGDLYLSRPVRSRILQRISEGNVPLGARATEALTEREFQVLGRLGRGESTREIADALGLSVKTIDTHRAKIMTRLGLDDGVQLLQRAVEWVRRRDDRSTDDGDGKPSAGGR